MRRLLLILSIAVVFFIILFSSMFSYIYNLDYYDKKYERHNIYNKFSREEALNATENLFGFFRSENELDMGFFNEQEASHLGDVKLLIQKAQQLYYLSITLFWIILIVFYLLNRKDFISLFSNILFYSGIAALSIIIIFSLLYLVSGFDILFIQFHEVFFTGNYAFNPEVSNMKALFPDEFFNDIAVRIFSITLLKAFLLAGFGYFLRASQNHPG